MSISNSKSQTRFQIIRNLIIFTVVALSSGFLGVLLDQVAPSPDPTQRLGALVWLLTPLVTVLLLRAFGGDGWQDFGLSLNLKSSWRWYLSIIVILPSVTVATLVIGLLTGGLTWGGFANQDFSAVLAIIGAGFLAVLVKNIFEEFAWRGYLTPRFAALKLHPILNHVLTGLIWAAWHIPYLLFFLKRSDLEPFTSLPTPGFIALAFLLLPCQAVLYGEMRLLSNSVWVPWLLHNVANALALPLLTYGFVATNNNWVDVFSPGTNGVIYSLFLLVIGLGLYRYRTDRKVPEPKQSLAKVTL